MNYPICGPCLKATDLCAECTERIREGAISPLDVELSKFMHELESRFDIANVDLIKTYDLDSFILIVGRGKISGMIGQKGRNIKLMASKFKKKVRIIKQGDIRQMVSDLIAPAQMSCINVLYTNEGEKYRVVVPDSDRKKIYMDEQTLNKAMQALFKDNVTIIFK